MNAEKYCAARKAVSVTLSLLAISAGILIAAFPVNFVIQGASEPSEFFSNITESLKSAFGRDSGNQETVPEHEPADSLNLPATTEMPTAPADDVVTKQERVEPPTEQDNPAG
ncbi:MAG: hypothetical protein ACREBU_06250 [Nitrososphaera sp.]